MFALPQFLGQPLSDLYMKGKGMKKFFLLGLVMLGCLTGCCNCQVEPIVEQNQKLIVPPNFGNMPK